MTFIATKAAVININNAYRIYTFDPIGGRKRTTHKSYIELAKNLEQIFDMQIGTIELSSEGELVIYNALAKAITDMTGRNIVDGTGKKKMRH
jgi:hypothetical protein